MGQGKVYGECLRGQAPITAFTGEGEDADLPE